MNTSYDIIVGQVFPQPVKDNQAFLSVYSESQIYGKYILKNKHGSGEREEDFDLTSQGDAVELNLAGLSPGSYSVHLEFDGKVCTRFFVKR